MDRLGAIALGFSGIVVFLTAMSVMDVSAEQQWTMQIMNMVDPDDASSSGPPSLDGAEGHEHSHNGMAEDL